MVDTITAGTEVAHGAGQAKAFPPLDPTTFEPQLFWLAITFATLYFVLARVALPRIGEVIEERRDRIQRDLDAADRLRDETEKALAAYESALADARASASTIAREKRDTLNAEVETERAKIEAEISARLADAESRIASTKKKALERVGVIASDTAAAVVTKLLGQDVSGDEVERALHPSAGE